MDVQAGSGYSCHCNLTACAANLQHEVRNDSVEDGALEGQVLPSGSLAFLPSAKCAEVLNSCSSGMLTVRIVQCHMETAEDCTGYGGKCCQLEWLVHK